MELLNTHILDISLFVIAVVIWIRHPSDILAIAGIVASIINLVVS